MKFGHEEDTNTTRHDLKKNDIHQRWQKRGPLDLHVHHFAVENFDHISMQFPSRSRNGRILNYNLGCYCCIFLHHVKKSVFVIVCSRLSDNRIMYTVMFICCRQACRWELPPPPSLAKLSPNPGCTKGRAPLAKTQVFSWTLSIQVHHKPKTIMGWKLFSKWINNK